MMYKDFVKDFALRTYDNFCIIENQHREGNDKAYEVTQLINSFIGLLIFPQQKYYKELKCQPFPNEIIQQKFEDAIKESQYTDEISFHNLIRHLRNSIAHNRLSVHPQISPVQNISGFKFEDEGKDPKTKIYCKMEIVFTIDEIKTILTHLLNYIKE